MSASRDKALYKSTYLYLLRLVFCQCKCTCLNDVLQARTVEKILEQLESSRSPGDQVLALKQLSELSVDGTFAQEFINHDGLTLIITKIETESWLVNHYFLTDFPH